MLLDIDVSYEGANTKAPGLPYAGVTIEVAFDNGTVAVSTNPPTVVFWGILGRDIEQHTYPVVSGIFFPTSMVFQGNVNNLYAEATVDAPSTPLTGTITASVALAYPVSLATEGVPFAQLAPGEQSVSFSVSAPSPSSDAARGHTRAASRAAHGLPREIREQLERR